MILANLYVVESADYTYLMNRTGLTWGNLSAHLSRLEEAGYVRIEKEFVEKKPHTMVRLTEEGRKAFEIIETKCGKWFLNLAINSQSIRQRITGMRDLKLMPIFGSYHHYPV